MKSLQTADYNRLQQVFIIVFSGIALCLIIGQLFVQYHITQQTSDARVINIAGRQRMLSHKVTKEARQLLTKLEQGATKTQCLPALQLFEQTLSVWKQSQIALRQGDAVQDIPPPQSEALQQMFIDIAPYHVSMIQNAEEISRLFRENINHAPLDINAVRIAVAYMEDNDPKFLPRMNAIVFQYDEEATDKVNRLRRVELIILFTLIGTLLCVLLFVFRPYSSRLRERFLASEQKSRRELELSEKRFRTLTENVDGVFMLISEEYGIEYANASFEQMFGRPYSAFQARAVSFEIIPREYHSEMHQVFDQMFVQNINKHLRLVLHDGSEKWIWFKTFNVKSPDDRNLLAVFCNDISEMKQVEAELIEAKEEALSSVRLKSIFVSVMSHEIR
ncbi:MAG: type IV pili methyl-accepting chemotaxis transducer N-terminal domain-containing protein, partial [Bacteroidota bacterium]